MLRIAAVVPVLLCLSGGVRAQDSLSGTWMAQRSGSRFWITLSSTEEGRQWHRSSTVWLSDLPEGEVSVEINRDPGLIKLDGIRRDDRAAGFFVFIPRLKFNQEIGALGYDPFDFDQLYVLTTVGAGVDEIARLRDLGYARLTTDELFAMHIHGALSDHIISLRQLGYDRLSVDDLISTRIHDVTAEYVKAMRALDVDARSIHKWVEMRIHDLTPEFIVSMRELDIDPRSIDKWVAMRIHDVTPEYVKSIRELGYEDATVDDLIGMRIHDVTPEFVKAVNAKLGRRSSEDR